MAVGMDVEGIRRYADPGYFRFAKPLEGMAIVVDRVLESLCCGWGRLYLTVTIKRPGVAYISRSVA